jgi:hypothetical protein
MPRTAGVNKASLIRSYMERHPDATDDQIIEAMKIEHEQEVTKLNIDYARRDKSSTGRRPGRPPKADLQPAAQHTGPDPSAGWSAALPPSPVADSSRPASGPPTATASAPPKGRDAAYFDPHALEVLKSAKQLVEKAGDYHSARLAIDALKDLLG